MKRQKGHFLKNMTWCVFGKQSFFFLICCTYIWAHKLLRDERNIRLKTRGLLWDNNSYKLKKSQSEKSNFFSFDFIFSCHLSSQRACFKSLLSFASQINMEVLLNKHHNKCFSLARRACEENLPESNFFLLKSLKKRFWSKEQYWNGYWNMLLKRVLTGKVNR